MVDAIKIDEDMQSKYLYEQSKPFELITSEYRVCTSQCHQPPPSGYGK